MNKQNRRGHLNIIRLVYILLAATGLGLLYRYGITAEHSTTTNVLPDADDVTTGNTLSSPPPITVTADRMVAASSSSSSSQRWSIPCSNQYRETTPHPGCTPIEGGPCDRRIVDDFLTTTEVEHLLRMAQTGMATSPTKSIVGPTIMDVNSGWVLAPGTDYPTSIYSSTTTGQQQKNLYTQAEYALYKDVTERLKTMVETTFEVTTALYFTAPTFITREVGNPHWQPTTMHDEYWHPHVDKNNTDHYDYSGLIYLSTYGVDFHGGGQLQFYNATTSLDCAAFVDLHNPGPCVVIGPPELIVEPRKGRVIVFGSGRENPHRVTRFESGTRFVLSFWFSCDARTKFPNFLDGKVHQTFEEKESGNKEL